MISHNAPQVRRDKKFARGCAGVDVPHRSTVGVFSLSLPGFVCLFVCPASFFRISLRDLCRKLLARSTSATKFVYFENGYDESSRAEVRLDYCTYLLPVLALHAMYDTVHRALIHGYTHTTD